MSQVKLVLYKLSHQNNIIIFIITNVMFVYSYCQATNDTFIRRRHYTVLNLFTPYSNHIYWCFGAWYCTYVHIVNDRCIIQLYLIVLYLNIFISRTRQVGTCYIYSLDLGSSERSVKIFCSPFVLFPLGDMKYLIFSFPRSGNDAKRNASRIRWRVPEDLDTRFPGSLCLSCLRK